MLVDAWATPAPPAVAVAPGAVVRFRVTETSPRAVRGSRSDEAVCEVDGGPLLEKDALPDVVIGGEGVTETVPSWDLVADGDGVPVGLAICVADRGGDGLWLGVPVGVEAALGLCVAVVDAVGVRDGLTVPDRELEGVRLRDASCVDVSEGLPVLPCVRVAVMDCVWLSELLAACVPEGLPDTLGVAVQLPVLDTVALMEPVPLRVVLGVGRCERDNDGVAVTDAVPERLGVGDDERVCEGDAEPVALPVRVWLGDCDGVVCCVAVACWERVVEALGVDDRLDVEDRLTDADTVLVGTCELLGVCERLGVEEALNKDEEVGE